MGGDNVLEGGCGRIGFNYDFREKARRHSTKCFDFCGGRKTGYFAYLPLRPQIYFVSFNSATFAATIVPLFSAGLNLISIESSVPTLLAAAVFF